MAPSLPIIDYVITNFMLLNKGTCTFDIFPPAVRCPQLLGGPSCYCKGP